VQAVNRRHEVAGSPLHLSALDGLRGLAVLFVIVYHSWGVNPPVVSPLDHAVRLCVQFGWSGVQLFFVLSGFLITGILLDSKDGQNYFRNFYLRRSLRIFPLFYAVFVIYLVAAAVLPHHFRPPLGAAEGQEAWYALYLSNFSMASQQNMAPSSLGVSWTLAIEEQFYLVWPLVVCLLPRGWLLRLCLTLVFLSFFWRLALTVGGVSPLVTLVLTPGQLDGLAVGAILAIWRRRPGGVQQLVPWARGLLLAVPPLLLLISMQAGDPEQTRRLMLTVGIFLFDAFFGAVLVLALSDTLLRRLLGLRALRACGQLSYGMYLFHPMVLQLYYALPGRGFWPLLLGSALPKQLLVTTVAILATVMIAGLSWKFYEQPFLRLKQFFPMHNDPKPVLEYSPDAAPMTSKLQLRADEPRSATIELAPGFTATVSAATSLSRAVRPARVRSSRAASES
jgi:peptidoglycan/LPS O-acetylase OafA/YrhL